MPFSAQRSVGFSGNRHGASSWTTRLSPRAEFLKMTDFLERVVDVTANFSSFLVTTLTYAMVNFVFFHNCNFLGLSTRDFSNNPEVCPARALSGCLVVRPSFSQPCSCVLWPVSCTRCLSRRSFSLSVLSRVIFCVPDHSVSSLCFSACSRCNQSRWLRRHVGGPEDHGVARGTLKFRRL